MSGQAVTPRHPMREFRASLLAIALVTFSPSLPAIALFDGPLERLPLDARVAVREGAAYVDLEAGQFRGYVLIDATPEKAWQVLTDYEQFPQFLPNTLDYTILSESGPASRTSETDQTNNAVGRTLQVESVTSARVLLLQVQSRDRFDIVEQPFERIEFELVSSETLRDMSGAWSLEVVESALSDRPQVLIGYEAAATPTNQFSAGAFANIFQTQLEGTLTAIQQEVLRRGS
ncbi:MAG: SRPBCC family protein [Cyanobacteria bacterium P01_F01_bin.33]